MSTLCFKPCPKMNPGDYVCGCFCYGMIVCVCFPQVLLFFFFSLIIPLVAWKTKKMKATSVLLVVVVLISALVASVNGRFVIGFLPAQNLTGYTLATLADIQSPAFLTQYNSEGLNFIQPFPDSVVCCVISIHEGYVSFGSSVANSNFVEPFYQGQDTCTSGTQPNQTTFGIPNFFPSPYTGLWLSTLTPKEQASLRVTGVAPPSSVTTCPPLRNTSSSIYPAIFKPSETAQYVVRPRGPNYPAPSSDYREMFVSDLTSDMFQSHYNSVGGILLTGVSSTNYCCLIRVANGGWLSYGPENLFSPLSLIYPSTQSWECSLQTNNQVHWLGTSFGGADPALLVTLNSTSVAELGYFVNNTQDWDGCQGLPDSLTLYMKV
jgi:hypothetical protein